MGSREKLRAIVDSKAFQAFIIAVILINAVVIGAETFPLSASVMSILVVIDGICIAIYTVEAILKIAAYRTRYFTDPWNIFDFVILILCLLPASMLPIPVQVARVLRITRALRVFRLVSALRPLRILVDGIVRAIPGVLWTVVLLLIVYYVFAIIGTVMFGSTFPDWFGNIGDSFYTLFQVMTLESWSMGISRPVMEVFPWAWAYFVPFVIVSAFVMANVVVGIIVGTMDEAREALEEEGDRARAAKDSSREVSPEASCEASSEVSVVIPAATLGAASELEEELAKLKAQIAVVESLIEKQKEE